MGVKVKAFAKGYANHQMYEPGQEFELEDFVPSRWYARTGEEPLPKLAAAASVPPRSPTDGYNAVLSRIADLESKLSQAQQTIDGLLKSREELSEEVLKRDQQLAECDEMIQELKNQVEQLTAPKGKK